MYFLKNLLPFPYHTMYFEVFCGGCTVVLHKIPCKMEWCNDINPNLIKMWRVIQNKQMLEAFKIRSKYELPSKRMFDYYKKQEPTNIEVEDAFRFFYLNRYGFSSIPKSFAGIHKRRAQKPESYLSALERIDTIYERLKKVTFKNQDYTKLMKTIIKYFDFEDTVIYCDPPYFSGFEVYNDVCDVCNWDNDIDQPKLVDLINQLKNAKIIISIDKKDYVDVDNEKWFRQDIMRYNASAPMSTKRNKDEEYIFRNFDNDNVIKMQKTKIKQSGLL